MINGKGYRVLNHVRVIQGDGINPDTIRAILQRITGDGYAADNVAFGMGGALLQRLDRDTQKFALKCSAARVDGEWVDVYRIRSPMPARPASVAACACCAAWMTAACAVSLPANGDDTLPVGFEDAMVTVWRTGACCTTSGWTTSGPGRRRDAEGVCGVRPLRATGIRPRA